MRNVMNRLVQNVHLAVMPLRVVLVLLFLLLVMFQTLSLPGQFRYMAEESPDTAYLRWPLTVVTVLMVACVQVVIVSIWRLLSMVRDDRIFTERSFVWVDAIVWAIAAGWVLLLGMFVYLVTIADDPGILVLVMLMLLAGGVLGLLMVVMRALLWRATTLRSEMDSVI